MEVTTTGHTKYPGNKEYLTDYAKMLGRLMKAKLDGKISDEVFHRALSILTGDERPTMELLEELETVGVI